MLEWIDSLEFNIKFHTYFEFLNFHQLAMIPDAISFPFLRTYYAALDMKWEVNEDGYPRFG